MITKENRIKMVAFTLEIARMWRVLHPPQLGEAWTSPLVEAGGGPLDRLEPVVGGADHGVGPHEGEVVDDHFDHRLLSRARWYIAAASSVRPSRSSTRPSKWEARAWEAVPRGFDNIIVQ